MKKVIILASAFLAVACASQQAVDRKVDAELKTEKSVSFGGDMARETRKLIDETPNLSDKQKQSLATLHARMLGEVTQIRDEMGKLKMLFFKAMLDPKADQREIRTLKERILSLDQKKTSKMLSAFEEVNSILGRKSVEDERLYRALFMPRSEMDLN